MRKEKQSRRKNSPATRAEPRSAGKVRRTWSKSSPSQAYQICLRSSANVIGVTESCRILPMYLKKKKRKRALGRHVGIASITVSTQCGGAK